MGIRMKKFTAAEIKAVLIEKRDTVLPDEDGHKNLYFPCANQPLGCDDTTYISDQENLITFPDRWTMNEQKEIYCGEYSHCRVCEKKIRPQIIASPGGYYSSVFGGRSFGGICGRCFKKVKDAREQLPKLAVSFIEGSVKSGSVAPLKDLKSLSAGPRKLYGYARLVHDKDPYRVIEIGYFVEADDKRGEDKLSRVTQIGTTCTMRRGKNVQVFKKRRTQVLNGDRDENDTDHSRYYGRDYEDNINRFVDYLRSLGYRVVERKDKRNGRVISVPYDEQKSKTAAKVEAYKAALDETLGDKHAEKLYKIDVKYAKTKPQWLDEVFSKR